jgi:hypothetical protein
VLKDEAVKYSLLVFMKLMGVIQDNGTWLEKPNRTSEKVGRI